MLAGCCNSWAYIGLLAPSGSLWCNASMIRCHCSSIPPCIVRWSRLRFGILVALATIATFDVASEPVFIGSRLELFVDDLLIEQLNGLRLKLHTPVRQPKARSPLPGDGAYFTVLKAGGKFQAYWRGRDPEYVNSKRWFQRRPELAKFYSDRTGFDLKRILDGEWFAGNPGEHVRYGESSDGHEWKFPELGLFELGGTKQNNVVLDDLPPLLTNFTPFIDKNPNALAAERYKALGGHPGYQKKRGSAGSGLHAFVSPDGVNWTLRNEVIPYPNGALHAFDSQNVAFWSEAEEQYICYFRSWRTKWGKQRTVSRTTSKDFLNWTMPVFVGPNFQGEHLYTNQTHPYFRAPHIYIALPTRFMNTQAGITDILFMSSRAGAHRFERPFKGAFICPGLDTRSWKGRANYVALNVHPTGSSEMSIWHKNGHRYTLRTDGFVSVAAGFSPGEMITKPFRFFR